MLRAGRVAGGTGDLCLQAPITEYEQLARHIGTFSSTSNQMVQTSDESKTVEIQTDDLEPQDQGCQVESPKGCQLNLCLRLLMI